MKLGFVCPDLPGHLNPMTVLAGQLQARNHEVGFQKPIAGAGGLQADHGEHRPAEWMPSSNA